MNPSTVTIGAVAAPEVRAVRGQVQRRFRAGIAEAVPPPARFPKRPVSPACRGAVDTRQVSVLLATFDVFPAELAGAAVPSQERRRSGVFNIGPSHPASGVPAL